MYQHAGVALIVVANVVSVISVIVLNKMLYQPPYNFAFPTLLISFHFLCTWLFVMALYTLRVFESKRLPYRTYIQLAAAQTASVCFVNLSLVFNSVGTYQVLKFTNIAVICIIEYVALAKIYPFLVYVSLAGIICGVCVATVTEVSFSATGLFYGLLGSLSTAIYQILNKYIQQTDEVSAMQLLLFESPFTVMWSLLFALVTEPVMQLPSMNFGFVGLALLSGLAAFGVNVTCYLIIGKTSPVTYGVVGHLKTCGVLLFGYVLLGQRAEFWNLMGIAGAFFSIITYTHLTLPK